MQGLSNFVKGMMSKFQPTFNFDDMVSGIANEDIFNFNQYPYPESPDLSQAELQYLQRQMALLINLHEDSRKEVLWEANEHRKLGNLHESHMLFKEHRKAKAELKKLSQLQYRLKHKIQPRG